MSTLNNSSMANYTYCVCGGVGGGRHVDWISVTMGTLMPCTPGCSTCAVLLHVNKALRLHKSHLSSC